MGPSFHTGTTLGDAFHAKYVNNLAESIDVPLSGKWETWSLLFRLHDRFPEKGLVRGPKPRPLEPEDGFDVTVAHADEGWNHYADAWQILDDCGRHDARASTRK